MGAQCTLLHTYLANHIFSAGLSLKIVCCLLCWSPCTRGTWPRLTGDDYENKIKIPNGMLVKESRQALCIFSQAADQAIVFTWPRTDRAHSIVFVILWPFKGTVSRDWYFVFEGLNLLISIFCVCTDGFQVVLKAFHYPIQLLTFYLLL